MRNHRLHTCLPADREFKQKITRIILLSTTYFLSRMKLLKRLYFGIPKIVFMVILLSGLSTALTGCGYTTRSLIAEKYTTIYIRQFKNAIDITSESSTARNLRVYYPGLETEVTIAIIDRFVLDGELGIGREDADLALRGEVTEFRRDPLRYTDDNYVEEYRVTIASNIALWDNKANKMLWRRKFTGDSSYFTQGTLAQSEETAVGLAVTDLARRVVEGVVEEW